jgi:hypothetical protein
MTHGMIVLTRNGKVVFKVIARCDGYVADAVCSRIASEAAPLSVQRLWDIANEEGFGCDGCRVVLGVTDALAGGEELIPNCRRTFADPRDNPLWWGRGICENYKLVALSGATHD